MNGQRQKEREREIVNYYEEFFKKSLCSIFQFCNFNGITD